MARAGQVIGAFLVQPEQTHLSPRPLASGNDRVFLRFDRIPSGFPRARPGLLHPARPETGDG